MNGEKSSTANATTATGKNRADQFTSAVPLTASYVGRFAPSPSGELHLGSLLTAAASFLDARAHGGMWLLRIEDLDGPRSVPGAAERILQVLRCFGFEWDGEITYQTGRIHRYEAALSQLEANGDTYRCTCSRRDLEGLDHYPGTCRDQTTIRTHAAATRLRTAGSLETFVDRIQGAYRQDVGHRVGDFILKRRDGIIAYALAVVVDDAQQKVTHVVRGADLLDQTGSQIWLQKRLRLPQPIYAHIPVLTEPNGAKLAKSERSVAVDASKASNIIYSIFNLLGLQPPKSLAQENVAWCWRWGIDAWSYAKVPRRLSIALDAPPDSQNSNRRSAGPAIQRTP